MKAIKLIVIIGILSITELSKGQQLPLLSNYYVNPYLNNPAYAGAKGSNIFLMNRSQWQGVEGKPETSLGTIDGTLNNGKVGYGLVVYNDIVNILGKTGTFGTYSYKASLGHSGILSFGLSLGFEQNRILFDRVKADVPVEITLINNAAQNSNFDANFGLSYHYKGLNLGVAGYQLFGNKNVLINSETKQEFNFVFERHMVGTASYRLVIKPETFYIDPLITLRTGVGIKPQADFAAMANIKDKLWIGAGYRQQYGMDFMAGTTLANKLTIGYAYGLSAGNIKKLSQNSHEVILGFKLKGKNTDMDSDKDGVSDLYDREPNTEVGCQVDKVGVSIDSDQDRLPDCLDKQIHSPFGAPVDSVGVALDSDKDNVIDMYDREPETLKGCSVDKFGIALDGDWDGVPDCKDKELNTPRGSIVDPDGRGLDTDSDNIPDIFDFEHETPHWHHIGSQPDLNASKCIVDKHGIAKDTDGDGIFDCMDLEIFSEKGVKVDKKGVAIKHQSAKEPEKSDDTDKDGVSDELDLEPNTPKGTNVDQWGRSPLVPKDPASTHRIEIDQLEDNSTEWDYFVIVGVFRYYNNLKNYQKYLLKTYDESTQVLVTEQNYYYVWSKQVVTRAEAQEEVTRLTEKRLKDYIVGNPWLWREPKKK